MNRPDPERATTPPDGRPLSEQPRWRRDFPIHLPEDEYVSRRDLVRFAVLVSGAFAVGQVWILAQNAVRRMAGRPPIREIAGAGALPPGKSLVFRYPGPQDICFLARQSDGRLVAFSQVCTHLSCAVIPDVPTGKILCPCHDGVFEMRSGRPLAGPPQRPLPRVQIEQRGGRIYATGMEVSTV